jgi:SAM-dependent methyltransferase
MWNDAGSRFLAPSLEYPELRDVAKLGRPELQPYQGLAAVWDGHVANILPDYPSFLASLARRRRLELRSVLDLACGTGLLTERLTGVAGEAVGLDSSEAMLTRARSRCWPLSGVELVCGDFRAFRLDRRFDAAVCASNSLNYVANTRELTEVFRSVAEHLRPGGVFMFDTLTEVGEINLSGFYYHVQAGEQRFAIWFAYDPRRRRSTSTVLLPEGVEKHRRVPLDPADVAAAAEGTGLVVDDYFSSSWLPWWLGIGSYCFFVLTRTA